MMLLQDCERNSQDILGGKEYRGVTMKHRQQPHALYFPVSRVWLHYGDYQHKYQDCSKNRTDLSVKLAPWANPGVHPEYVYI